MSLVYGFGVNDFKESISLGGVHIREYSLWKAMLRRCYSDDTKIKRPTYNECVVEDYLLSFDNFYNFINSLIGFNCKDVNNAYFHLDKDLIGSGKIYSRDTICFIPSEVNAFLTNKKSTIGDYPTGVLFHKASGRLIAQINKNGKKKYLGLFDDPIDAFAAYKLEKDMYAKELAEKYKKYLDDRAYIALKTYEEKIYV